MASAQLLLILVIAPSAIYALPQGSGSDSNAAAPGSAGHHGNVQAGAFPFPHFRPSAGATFRDALGHGHGHGQGQGQGQGQPQVRVPYVNDPATSQHMSINNDGRYSFSYSAGSSAREERREPDGSVQGKYSYIDPTGKLVEVEYTADAASGFNAYGENVPPKTIAYAPYPVQDTPDVSAARAKFLAYYQQEWNARKELEAIENATATPSPVQVQAQIQTGGGQNQQTDTVSTFSSSTQSSNRIPVRPISDIVQDDEDDTEVVNRDDADSDSRPANSNLYQPQPLSSVSVSGQSQTPALGQVQGQNAPVVGDGASYSLNFDVGNGPATGFNLGQFQPQAFVAQQQQFQQQSQQQQQTQQVSTKSGESAAVNSVQGPGYFYYMSVGGLPYYVTSLPTRTNVAVSVRASQLGAIPAAAVHDVQTPHYGGVYKPKQSPAVYVEVGQDYNDVGSNPTNTITPQHFRQHQSQHQVALSAGPVQAGQLSNGKYPLNFPYFGYPVYVY